MPYTYDDTLFRQQFTEFANVTTYPTAILSMYYGMATNFMASSDAPSLYGDAMIYALNLLTAHIAKSSILLASGINTVLVTGSSEGSVSVSLTPPPVKSAWQWWLSTTGYGTQYRALLMARRTMIQYEGGSSERASFRKSGGVF